MIVTGFYTPSYAELAGKLEASLSAQHIPYHFYPMQVDGPWDRQLALKPKTVQRAMRDFPGRDLVLMDVDCIIKGDISGIASVTGDMALRWMTKPGNNWPSSRVVVFRPSRKTTELVDSWAQLCEQSAADDKVMTLNDERMLARAIARTSYLSLTMLPDTFAGLEIDEAPLSAAIVHDSAHDRTRRFWGVQKAIKAWRRSAVERVVGKPYEQWKHGA